MTTYTVEALLQAIDECPNAVYGLGNPHKWIRERARELAAAQPSADGPCQFCGGVGCVRCSARKQPSASEPVTQSVEPLVQIIHSYISEYGGYTIGRLREALQLYNAPQPSPQQAGTRKVTEDAVRVACRAFYGERWNVMDQSPDFPPSTWMRAALESFADTKGETK